MREFIDIVENMKSSSKASYIDVCMQAIQLLNDLTHRFKTDTSMDTTTKRFFAGSQLARWWNDHFSEIKSYAHDLKKHKTSYMYRVAMIPVSALKSSNPDNNFSKSSGMQYYLGFAAETLKELGEHALAQTFSSAYNKFQEARDIEDTRKSQTQPKQNNDHKKVIATQNQAVEDIVNKHIASLPAGLQHAAREAVSRSANKLQALQQFLRAQAVK